MFKPGITFLVQMAAHPTSWHLEAAEGSCHVRFPRFLDMSLLRNQLSGEAMIISPRTPRMYCFFLLCLSVSSGATGRDMSEEL